MAAGAPGAIWDELDPTAEPTVRWVRVVGGSDDPRSGDRRIMFLLGAFDPPTNAHLDVLRAASRAEGVPGAFCLTRVLLDRPPDELLRPADRIELLDRLSADEGMGFVLANRGTYLDVARALRANGVDPTFVIGSDKLAQLADPTFYDDGDRGVAATFDGLRFVVIPRPPVPVDRDDVVVLRSEDVFASATAATISASDVRRRIRAGEPIGDLVPSGVARAVRGYTQAK